jgi:hypothetical protein
VLEKPMTCKSGLPTQDGSKYSNMRTTNSLIGQTTRYLMSRAARTKKVKQLESLETTEVKDNNGKLFILIKPIR